ncbi:MAG: DUF1127 domain-containing protein [Alphaproteobacteria bacterium]|nr:DUF1127 domain-containing protein [Alphaproteobacteria bacterium]
MSFTLTGAPRPGPHAGWAATCESWTPIRTGLLSRMFGALLAWQERAFERHRMAELSDHTLRDIGMTRADFGIAFTADDLGRTRSRYATICTGDMT